MKNNIPKRTALKIHNLRHLEYQLGIPSGRLIQTASKVEDHYERFNITKSGKLRVCYNPNSNLRTIQNRIRQLLEKLKLSEYLKGGIKGESAFTNARSHLGAKFFLNLDISNFYSSITYRRVYQLFQKLTCQPDVARILTRLTTADYHLPTGFVTSPLIANLIIHSSFGNRLNGLAKSRRAKYTQFYDDMTISGGNAIRQLNSKVRTIIEHAGFLVHPHKGGFFTAKQNPKITGFQVGRRITIDREYRKSLRKILSDCRKFGPSRYILSHLDKESAKRIDSVDSLRQHLQGRVNYLRRDSTQFDRFKRLFDQIDWTK